MIFIQLATETFAIWDICYPRHLLSETITIFHDSSDSISIIVFSCTTVYYIVVKVDIHLLCHFKISVEWYSISNYFSMIKLLFRVEVRPITYFNMEVFKVNFMYYVHTLPKFQSNLSKIPCDFANSKWDFEFTKCQWIHRTKGSKFSQDYWTLIYIVMTSSLLPKDTEKFGKILDFPLQFDLLLYHFPIILIDLVTVCIIKDSNCLR